MKLNKLFSWKDIERVIMINEDRWNIYAYKIIVYADSIEVSLKEDCYKNEISRLFSEIFEGNFIENTIVLDINNEKLYIDFDGEEEEICKKKIPLFKKMLYQQSVYEEEMFGKTLDGSPIIAFHSYKGGVGRTLSMLAFAKAWISMQSQKKCKLLIVDCDIEAPGLTWLQNEESEQHYSFLDLLESIQNRRINEDINIIVEQIKKSTLKISTTKEITEQFFIPTYRYKEQLIDIYSKPENIVSNIEREYIIAEVLSKLGKSLDVDMVLIDLRAGLSEYSAPLLFDPRVKKYFVTSTSAQSVQGLSIVLEQVSKGLKVEDDVLLPEVFLTMIPDTIDLKEKSKIVNDIVNFYYENNEDGSLLIDNLITELPFSSELIHLSSLQQIMRVLGESSFYRKIENIVSENYASDKGIIDTKISDNRETVINNIHDFAVNQVTAEGNEAFDLLITQAISNLKKKYKNEIPCTVVMGAKGSGKTFLYRELLAKETWDDFCAVLDKENVKIRKTFLVPVLAAKNAVKFSGLLKNCIEIINSNINFLNINSSTWYDNAEKLTNYIQNKHSIQEWKNFWEKFFLETVSLNYKNFYELDDSLAKIEKNIVFIVDGLEEILQNTIIDESQQIAILALCQDFVNALTLRYKNIGCIIFLRKDLARDSIKVNFEQFNQLYNSVELQWTRDEALRLALWLVNQAQANFYSEDTPIEVASREIIEKQLQKLWGIKLGKPSSNEAYSARWILAALSDFNGQLQARDIIRFLQYATSTVGKAIYDDRYIMPVEIKNAVPYCSAKKIEEIKQEIGSLREILLKLEKLPPERKTLPFSTSNIELSAKEENLMIREGYLKTEDGKYYLPEIIRHSLGFKYEKGARPKVLSLIKNI